MITSNDLYGFGSSPQSSSALQPLGGGNSIASYLQQFSAGKQNDPWNSGGFDLRAPNAAAGQANGLGGNGLGFNMDTGKLVLGGLQTIGNLWTAWQANKNAKEQFKYTKDITEQNMSNQLAAYNTGLEDRINSRFHTEGKSDAEAQAYIKDHKLERSSSY